MNFYFEQKRNLLIYPEGARMLHSMMPDALDIERKYLAVPRTLRNCQVLRHYNYPVPPIIDGDYDWPSSPDIYARVHQKLMANFSVLHPRMFNLSDPGAMKTLSTLWAADWLMRQYKEDFRALIVAPLSILESVWAAGIFRNFLSKRKAVVLYGDAAKRAELLRKDADFYIINFDGVGIGARTQKRIELAGLSKELAERRDIRLAIVDEASGYRDATTRRHKVARMVIGRRDYLWMITGTPTPNAPTDAYGLAKIVNNAFGKSFTSFRDETMTKVTQFKFVPRKDGYEKARRLLTPAIRIDIKDVWDAPPTTTQQREIALTDHQKRALSSLKNELQVLVKSGQPITVANEGAARSKLIQISLGAVYDANHDVHLIDSGPRLKEAEQVIENTSRKVVVFVPLTSVVNLVYRHLSKKWGCAILNGAVTMKERAQVIRRFADDDKLRVVIADPQTTAHGINEFVEADTVLWYGPCEKNELYIQGNRRVNRPGQKHPNTIIQLVSTSTEKEIYRRLETNSSMQGLLLDMVRDMQW